MLGSQDRHRNGGGWNGKTLVNGLTFDQKIFQKSQERDHAINKWVEKYSYGDSSMLARPAAVITF